MKKRFVTETFYRLNDFVIVVIFTHMGYRCGYVGVPYDHPLNGKSYTHLESRIDVHGGLTYSGRFHGPHTDSRLDTLDEEGYWFFGFDCAHLNDALDMEALEEYGMHGPQHDIMARVMNCPGNKVRTHSFCSISCYSLAQQLAKVTRTQYFFWKLEDFYVDIRYRLRAKLRHARQVFIGAVDRGARALGLR